MIVSVALVRRGGEQQLWNAATPSQGLSVLHTVWSSVAMGCVFLLVIVAVFCFMPLSLSGFQTLRLGTRHYAAQPARYACEARCLMSTPQSEEHAAWAMVC